jgi:hypothetical protein
MMMLHLNRLRFYYIFNAAPSGSINDQRTPAALRIISGRNMHLNITMDQKKVCWENQLEFATRKLAAPHSQQMFLLSKQNQTAKIGI